MEIDQWRRWGGGGPPRVTPDLKLISLWLNLERTLDKRRGKIGVVRKRHLKKVITFRGDDLKRVVKFFEEKNRVTPISCRPG